MADRAPFDANLISGLIAASTLDGVTPVTLWADPATHKLQIGGTIDAALITGNVAAGVTDSGNPVKVGGKYNSANVTLADGQRGDLQLDVNAFTRVTLATALKETIDAVASASFGHSYGNITTATTTTVKSGSGVLSKITVNTPVASATITIYDNTAGSGNKIATITLGGTLANDTSSSYLYDVAFTAGLTIVTSGATDITVSYR